MGQCLLLVRGKVGSEARPTTFCIVSLKSIKSTMASGEVHGLRDDVVAVDAVLNGFFLVIAVSAGKQQNFVCPVFLWVQHVIANREFRGPRGTTVGGTTRGRT